MVGKVGIFIGMFIVVVLAMTVQANPLIDSAGEMDYMGVCLRNCALCKKMYGSYFEGQMCADACVKFKGKIIPDCEDIGSIAPFLNKL